MKEIINHEKETKYSELKYLSIIRMDNSSERDISVPLRDFPIFKSVPQDRIRRVNMIVIFLNLINIFNLTSLKVKQINQDIIQ